MNKLLAVPLVLSLLLGASGARAEDAAPPAGAPPAVAPPPPPPAASVPPPPPAANESPSEADGQWTYTSQYGWLWMPYNQAYTYVSAGSDVSYEYVYYPAFGWRWVASPWVFGYGPTPYWGARGRAGFAWYAHPWFRSGAGYRGQAPRTAHYGGAGYRGGARGGGAHGRR